MNTRLRFGALACEFYQKAEPSRPLSNKDLDAVGFEVAEQLDAHSDSKLYAHRNHRWLLLSPQESDYFHRVANSGVLDVDALHTKDHTVRMQQEALLDLFAHEAESIRVPLTTPAEPQTPRCSARACQPSGWEVEATDPFWQRAATYQQPVTPSIHQSVLARVETFLQTGRNWLQQQLAEDHCGVL
ncbi:MAG: hypothetical protein SFZ03_10415 [Candidatus Melainabacteria bacterium]|nr:hypothetical protein [Candidatus Melainabacteria bacterium]